MINIHEIDQPIDYSDELPRKQHQNIITHKGMKKKMMNMVHVSKLNEFLGKNEEYSDKYYYIIQNIKIVKNIDVQLNNV